MTPQHLHTPLVWFSGRADCVPWCVRGREEHAMSDVKQICLTPAQRQAAIERAERNIPHHARWNANVPMVTCPCCGRDTYEDAVDIDVFRKFAAWADHATTGV